MCGSKLKEILSTYSLSLYLSYKKSAAFLHWNSIIYGVICVAGYIFPKKNAEHLTPLSFSHATNRRN